MDSKLVNMTLDMLDDVTHELNGIKDDTGFYSKYEIIADNNSEAQSLLTSNFAEKLENIKNTFMAYSVDFVFKDGYLYLFIGGPGENETVAKVQKQCSTSNFFEVGYIDSTLLDKNIYLKTFKELLLLFSLIDSLSSPKKTEEQ